MIATVEKTYKIYTNQTIKPPITSIRVNKYILIMHVYDYNAILSSPLKSSFVSHILKSYTKQVEHLTNIGYIQRVHWLDNESSASLNKYKKQKDIEYQLVPPHIHRVNAAERAIRTCKYYRKSRGHYFLFQSNQFDNTGRYGNNCSSTNYWDN